MAEKFFSFRVLSFHRLFYIFEGSFFVLDDRSPMYSITPWRSLAKAPKVQHLPNLLQTQ